MLVAPPENATDENHGVYLFLSGETGRLELKEIVPNLVWSSSALFGQNASLEAMPNGSFVIVSQNAASGRYRWEQRLTVPIATMNSRSPAIPIPATTRWNRTRR